MASNIRILLIEDNYGDARLIQEYLKSPADFLIDFVRAKSLNEALLILEKDNFNVILLDLILPDSDGIETLKKIIPSSKGIPIIVMTGIREEQAGVISVQEGAQDYLVKGQVNGISIIRAIRYAIERKQAVDSLRQSEEKYRMLIELSSDAIFLADASTGVIIDINKKAEELLEMSRNEIIGQHQTQLHPQSEKDYYSQLFANSVRKKKAMYLTGDFFLVSKSGKNIPVSIGVSTVEIGGKQMLQGVFRDITLRKELEGALRESKDNLEIRVQRRTQELAKLNVELQEKIVEHKKTESALAASEDRYHKIITSITDYIYTVKLKDGLAIQTVYSDACLGVTGFTSQEFSNDPNLWIKMVYDEDKFKVVEWSNRIIKGEKVDSLEHRIVRKDVQVRWISNTPVMHNNELGILVSYDGVVQDITDSKLAEQRRIGLEALAQIIDNSPDCILIVDLEGKVIKINKTVKEEFGFDLELIGSSLAMLVKDESFVKLKQFLAECLEKGHLRNLEITAVDIDKKEIPALVSASVLGDYSGQAKGIIITITDISDRKHIEELKDEFISIVSHEMRTPLAAIREGVSLVLDGIVGDIVEKQKDILFSTQKNIDRLSRFINNILDYQKLDYGKARFSIEEASVNNVITELKDEFEMLARTKNLELVIKLADNMPNVKCDTDKIGQVLLNLVHNAVRFTDAGQIIISSSVTEKNEVCVCVEDTGIGIKQENLGKLFSPFMQLSSADRKRGSGSGLGLVISKKIIEQHDGRIWVESIPEKGSKFYFILPVV